MRNRIAAALIAICLLGAPADSAQPQLEDGAFRVTLRDRVPTRAGGESTKPRFRTESWDPSRTAVIVCDMWDAHHSYNAVQRVNDLAPRMDEVLAACRDAGALILHAPSSCVAAYAEHPARARAAEAPSAGDTPPRINEWNHGIASEESVTYPIDQSDGGDDDDPAQHAKWRQELIDAGRNPDEPWLRQIDRLRIDPADALTDSGEEAWNLLESRKIDNVIFLGVHTNMCVLGRPFGLRQLASNGKNVVLVRDLTDTMYNPASWPHVAHHTGTDFIIEYIEQCVCPTILSTDLIGGTPHRLFDDKRPTVAMVISEFEYETYQTLPRFARDHLGKEYRVEYAVNDDIDLHRIDGLDVLETADVVVLSVWRRVLPAEQLAKIRAYVESGRPLVAIRTTSHAFAARGGWEIEGATWPDFDREVLGSPYTGHYSNHIDRGDPPTRVSVSPDSPLSGAWPEAKREVASWLYKMGPLAESARPLLVGSVADGSPHPVAWTNVREGSQRVFYTSLGSPADFEMPEFNSMLKAAIDWAAELN